ncbi:phage adaptor protein [Methylobacterium sp. Leaf85]|uniref:phage adaptor protein n=1 Tax=Methylobacterium sp. Leaf85 TaxID=1736241 RepID=UPI0006F807A4|nr:hypothetical protein [Methylobacterium sp. Leaf85]KQO43026.1 hypothetical protein ASF08_10640 [Methylobacterium sp. Leaf85]
MLDTYQDLVASIEDYLERADLLDRIGTFVRLAELRLTRRLGLAENEVQARLDLVAGRAPLPNDYSAVRGVTGAQGWDLEYVPPHVFLGTYGRGFGLRRLGQGDGYDDVRDGIGGIDGGGRPRWYTILGSIPLDDIDVDVSVWPNGLNQPFLLTAPAGTGQISLLYRQGVPSLGPTRASNWLLARNPDLYLYASLLEAEPFLENDRRVSLWQSMLETAISDVTSLDRESRWGRARMRSFEPTP